MTSAYNQGQVPDFQMRHRLQLAREHAGYDRDQLATAMEVSRNSIYNAESGRVTPRKIMLNAWALACGVPVDWIITGQPPQNGGGPTSGLGIISDTRSVTPQGEVTPIRRGHRGLQDRAAS